MSLEQSDAESAAIATAPRVTLADLEGGIAARYEMTGIDAIGDSPGPSPPPDNDVFHSLSVLSICILVMQNGFTIIGKSAPASAANFNAEFGRKLAYEDAVRQLWPLEGYMLRSILAEQARDDATDG